MARPESFDREAVVRAARNLFWSTGYESSSIADIEMATGLSRSSIYNAFGSKRGLFDEAVQSYLEEVVRPRLRPLAVGAIAVDAIATYLSELHAMFRTGESMAASQGCLLVNTARSALANDPQITRAIRDYLSELHSALESGILARRPELDVPAASCLADAVTGLVVAAFSVARVDVSQSARCIETALDLLDQRRVAIASVPR
ncbi:TetR/AcrR family transcriptional regulator [Microbacterium resistens]|uniref:TetR/AcrR family transcriptional regulator n=1 Tax=Microbacterium resistens TaxID=156977 RepID=A0ABY3RZ54_9MICO|nr:TetR/AcrR family transcriptional regulator [Microbacterium resistens]UGS28373.1 TetR/AcrR family transcriptional regulator [Microbacterium resistens]